MPIEERPVRRPAPRTCKRCGQPINTQTDSWEMKHSDDGQYLVGIQHVTCPISPEMQDLPALKPTPATPEGETPSVDSEFVRMEEAARLICVSKGTIRNYIRSGKLPAKRLGSGPIVLVKKQDVLALLEDIVPGTKV